MTAVTSSDASDHEVTDHALLQRWRHGDAKAGADLYDRYAASLHRFFRSKISGSDADLMQQTFLACLEHADRITTPSARAYLFAVARNLVGSHYRGRAAVPLITSVAALDPSLSSVVQAKQTSRALLEALRRIPLDDQILIELHYWERLTTTELSIALGRPQGTIKTHLVRARERLEAELAAVMRDPIAAASTIDGLAGWAAEVRAQLDAT